MSFLKNHFIVYNNRIIKFVIFIVILNSFNKLTSASNDGENIEKTTAFTNIDDNRNIDKFDDTIIENDSSDDKHHIIDLRKHKNKSKNNKNVEFDDKLSNIDIISSSNVKRNVLDAILNRDLDEPDPRTWTKYVWLMELFDHHKFDVSSFNNTSKSCADDMMTYLTSLRQGEAWAAKMHDASGRNSGQFFFDNNFWLGSKALCKELQYNITPPLAQDISQHLLRIPPFKTRFSTAVVKIDLGVLTSRPRILLLGVCLPSSCSTIDVHNILDSDAKLSVSLAKRRSAASKARSGNSSREEEKTSIDVVRVRAVPGSYDIFQDKAFHILGGVTICVVALIALATSYEMYVNYKNKQVNDEKTNDNCENGAGDQDYNNKYKTADGGKSVNGTNGFHTDNNNGLVNGTNEHELTSKSNGYNGNGNHHNGNGNHHNGNGNHHNGNGNHHGGEDLKSKYGKVYGEDVFSRMLLCFSAITNTAKIMSTDDSTDAINCIHGLRFLSLSWVILVHTYLSLFQVADNKTLREVTERNFFYQTVGNASYSVDTFFFISGLLLTYLYQKILTARRKNDMKKYEKLKLEQPASNNRTIMIQHNTSRGQHKNQHLTNGNQGEKRSTINGCHPSNGDQILQMHTVVFQRQSFLKEAQQNVQEFLFLMFNRFVRLTSPYLFTIGLNLIVLRYAYNNSVFEPILNEHVNCAVYWWRNILYINNFYPSSELCMRWSWYMASDTQFYVIGILLMILSKRHPKLSLTAIGVLIVSSWLTTGYISLANNYRAKIRLPFEMFDQIYIKPWSRLGPYLVGMLTGWYLWKWNDRIVLPKWLLLLGWPSSLAVMGSLIYCMKDGYLDIWPSVFYTAIGHTAWSMALSWLVICCVSQRGGLICTILSYRGVYPLSRLAYCAYLTHIIILFYTTYSSDGPVHLHNGYVLVIYAGICVMSYLVSFVLSLLVEVPVVRLLKMTYRAPKKKNV